MSGPKGIPLTKHEWALHALNSGEYSTAATVARSVLEKDPSDAVMHSCLGSALARMGNFEEGIQEHQRSIEIEPDSYDIWHNFGVTLALASYSASDKQQQIELFEKAGGCYHKALYLNPKSYISYTTAVAAHMHLATLDPEKTAEHHEQADQVVWQYFLECEEKIPMHQSIGQVGIGGRLIEIKDEFRFQIIREGDRILCQHRELNIEGTGPTFTEAIRDLHFTFELVFADFKGDLSDILSEEVRTHVASRLAEMEEATEEILEDSELMASIKRGEAEVQAGQVVDWEEVG